MNAKVTQVRDALVSVLKKLKISNGFRVELPDDHIHLRYSSEIVSSKSDSLFPKCFVIIENGRVSNQPSNHQEKRLNFTVLIVVKATPATGNVDSQTQIELFVEEMEKLLFQNDDLNGTVQDAQLTEWTTDGGVTKPEGVAAFQIETIRYSNSMA